MLENFKDAEPARVFTIGDGRNLKAIALLLQLSRITNVLYLFLGNRCQGTDREDGAGSCAYQSLPRYFTYFFGILPLSSLPLQFLEAASPEAKLKHIDGIIVLGGFTGNGFAESHDQYGFRSAERFTAAMVLAASFTNTNSLSGFPVS